MEGQQDTFSGKSEEEEKWVPPLTQHPWNPRLTTFGLAWLSEVIQSPNSI